MEGNEGLVDRSTPRTFAWPHVLQHPRAWKARIPLMPAPCPCTQASAAFAEALLYGRCPAAFAPGTFFLVGGIPVSVQKPRPSG